MPRFIDEIRAQGAFQMPSYLSRCFEADWKRYSIALWPIVTDPDLPVILIDNVAEYYYQSDQEFWDLRHDFPSFAPPYPQFWMEHRIPKKIRSKEAGETNMEEVIQNGRVGMLIGAFSPSDVRIDFPEEISPEAKWVLACEMWVDFGRGDVAGVGPNGACFLCITAEGKLVGKPWTKPYVANDEDALGMMALHVSWFKPGFLAMSFLHCKNVAIVDERVDKPLAKKWFRKTGRWPTPYKTLVIEPLKQILKREGGADKVGVAKAMHICRGHFSDYREGRGLFGKYKKLVWIPMTVRGTGRKAPPREMEIKL